MKKVIIILLLVLGIVFWAVHFFVPSKIVSMVTDYEPYTFEAVLKYDSMKAKYGIGENDHPEDYGFDRVTEVDFESVFDNLSLNGWYVESAPASSTCVLLLHGRTSNRLKPMKYLQLFKDAGLDTIYNFFIPDLRNSGKSEPSKTYMGYKFAEDVAASVQWVSEQKGQRNFILYGFSMGAMAIEVYLGRDDLRQYGTDLVEAAILDSPLSNAKRTLQVNADAMGIPQFVFERTYDVFGEEINGFEENLAFSELLGRNNLPTLILSSEDDQTTFFDMLTAEIDQVGDSDHIVLKKYSGVDHVRLYQTPELEERYRSEVATFLNSLPQ